MGLQVVKRNGQKEDVRFDAIQEKLSRLSEGLNQDWEIWTSFLKLFPGHRGVSLNSTKFQNPSISLAQHPVPKLSKNRVTSAYQGRSEKGF
ncbi:MAG: hypothetical protein CM15mP71_1950 [Candidatus Poseidoniales archaeon]|nr:MAG: hypothetical protein CM15mP71_1950 [Candidatus Poseidoniales archaeon]